MPPQLHTGASSFNLGCSLAAFELAVLSSLNRASSCSFQLVYRLLASYPKLERIFTNTLGAVSSDLSVWRKVCKGASALTSSVCCGWAKGRSPGCVGTDLGDFML
ncbi:hypothetical protein BDN72DRAFT_589497 [Pluteus cervinus]|uniref:Uncharacterized protein n=1 Tax=Pluteus cervinus TaxID=181527 RepID=A0ACD3A2P3_9AGAR|nr:hypothetical protein BDN72DRAFT_589497 [Pluteus cervinus]